MIQVNHIGISKGGRAILQQVSMRVRPGRVSVVVGPNGAGKSTLLRLLTGREKPDTGEVRWDGRPLSTYDLPELAQRRAVLSQSVQVSFPITVSELVEMGTYAAQGQLSGPRLRRIVAQALQEVNMWDFRDRLFNNLSGGEQQRVLFAKCLTQLGVGSQLAEHQYLFLDEPTASLDLQQQFRLLEWTRRLVREQQIGVLAVLHDLNLAAQFADEIILLRAGHIVAQGAPEQVLTPELIAATLEVTTLVQAHPVLGCPYVIPLPTAVSAPAETA